MSESQPPSGERVMSRFAADPDTMAREKPRRSDTGRTRFTPLDIQSHQFGRSLRGCDPGEVTSFLRLVAEDVERSVRESEELRERKRELEIRVDSLNEREEVLKRTLMTAQEVSEDIRNTAAREAEVILAEAEVKAEKVLDAAHRRVARLQEDIREMRSLRIRIATAVRTTIETHLALLEGLSEDPEADPILDAKVAHLARAKAPPDDRGAGEA
jgi:cell division initiation protein